MLYMLKNPQCNTATFLYIFTNIELYYELKKLNFVFLLYSTLLFPPCNYLCNYLAVCSILSFCYKNICTLLFKTYFIYFLSKYDLHTTGSKRL